MAEPAEEEAVVFLERTSRATRGKRMTKLLDEEIEEDELFWNQDALKEEEDDVNYVEEAEVADEFDSDFDEDEPEPEEEGQNEAEERVKPKKKLIFPGKTAKKKKSTKASLQKPEGEPKDEEPPQVKKPKKEEHQDTTEDFEGERSVRKSTRTSVIVRQAEREAIKAALQATMKHPVKRKKEGEEKKMTQEEMLLEAAQTEIMNLRNLERVLAREEEVKKKAIVHKEVYTGPQIRYYSRDGRTFLEFCNGADFSSEINTSPPPYPEKSICVVTGLPARYRDPKTGLPYATMDAFKVIRERYLKEESEKRKQRKMDMGPLFDDLMGQGFPSKRERSGVHRTKDFRTGARFRRMSPVEIYDLD